MGSMFIAARCAPHFQFNTNSSHHYTNSLVAIAFYRILSIICNISEEASEINWALSSQILLRIERPNCRAPRQKRPPPSSRHFVRLVVELGRFTYSFCIGKKYGVSCECRRKDSWVDVPEKRCKIPTLLQSSGSKVKANLTLPTIVPGFRYRYMGVWILSGHRAAIKPLFLPWICRVVIQYPTTFLALIDIIIIWHRWLQFRRSCIAADKTASPTAPLEDRRSYLLGDIVDVAIANEESVAPRREGRRSHRSRSSETSAF